MKSVKTWKKLLSVVLSSAIIVTTLAPGAVASAAENPSVQQGAEVLDFGGTSTDISSADQTENSSKNAPAEQNADDAVTPDEESNTQDTTGTAEDAGGSAAVKEQQSESAPAENEAQTKAAADTNLYQDGSICIYNEQQLRAIGNGAQVYEGDASADTFGTGAALTKEDGSALTYAADGTYTLMNDIPLTEGSAWTLPEGFAGAFKSDGGSSTTVYDSETDTIYLYHQYQLEVIAASENPDEEPVMTEDYDAAHFGMGQMIWPDGEDHANLTYSMDHNYVVSKYFTEETPELIAAQAVEGELSGREYVGQVIFNNTDAEGNVEQYILIGNKQQLEAIGKTDSEGEPIKVTEPVWAQNQIFEGLIVGIWSDRGDPYLYYSGDADLKEGEVLYDDPEAGNPGVGNNTVNNGVYPGQERQQHFGSRKNTSGNETTYTYDKNAKKHINMERQSGDDSDPAYTTWANYIIFRDIDLSGEDWKPLMFSGNMEGRLNMKEGTKPTIRNITVVQDEALKVNENIGIGFFGTITNKTSDDDIGLSGGKATVKNIILDTVSVENKTTEVNKDTSLIEGLVKIVGGLLGVVGGLVDGIFDILDSILGNNDILGELNLSELLGNLLNAKQEAPDTFATGAFAGRIVGEVEVAGCEVKNATVTNVTDMTGGFVGNAEGIAEYEGLGTKLKGTVDALEGLLNVIPGLGLGDLIPILLDNPNLLKVSELLPTGYKQAVISKCRVSMKGTEIGSQDSNFVGGFAGAVTGSNIENSSVNNLTKVTAGKYAGGFSGITRDATIKALLTDLGIDLVLDPSSEIIDCKVNYETKEVNLEVYSASDYAGGFTGVTANSSITSSSVEGLKSSVEGLKSVIAEKNYAGGFTGRATVGYAAVLGKTDEADTGLLEKIGGLLSGITAGELDPDLVNLAGIQPSKLDGCKVSGTDFTVEAKEDYAGGFFAEADGVIMDGTTKSEITGIKSVTAKNYAGGISGKAAAANAAGVLNNTLGIGTMLAFSAKNIELTGATNGLTVTATENYAGGAFGQAIGGNVDSVILKDVTKVEANNYAGGFAGDAGTGSLVEGGGLNLLGLIKIDNLLSLAKGVVLNISNSSVTGTVTGTGTEENKIGLSVSATGSNSDGAVEDFVAGGFIGESKSVVAANCTVNDLKSVAADNTDGYAGGFTGTSEIGGLASIAEDKNNIPKIVDLGDLVSAAGYLIPKYNNCHVSFIPNTEDEEDGARELPQVQAAVAGGFVGELTGGKVNVTKVEEGKDIPFEVEDKTAVKNIENVKGTYFAGGFAGLATSGGLAETGGLSLLGGKIKLGSVESLISVLEVYMPVINYAGVSAGEKGLVVSASDKMAAESSKDDSKDEEPNADLISSNSGSAGGYVGYGCGVRIADSDVIGLRATDVAAPDPLRSEKGESYFGADSKYAVTAPRYAGGYAGKLDIGNAASLGLGLGIDILGIKVGLDDVTGVLAIVASKIENSDVSGKTGGFSVLANEKKENVYTGHAGGYVGMMSGAEITSSNVDQFNYIVGGESAGGYAGTLEPGNVASVLGEADILDGLVSADNLLSALQTFVPFITNSTTAAVPCGGVVRAENGSAGGYAGHSLGGQIKGTDGQEAAIYRIRSVYGQDYAGGFTGLAEAANAADTGNLKILGGFVELKNPLGAVQIVYAQEENTAVYGPLSHMNVDTWNAWVTGVGAKGPYGKEFKDQTFEGNDAQSQLDEFLADYTYGYEVVAPGADEKDGGRENGYAGGYVGKMTGAQITNGQAHDLMDVTAWNSAGGFVGVMTPGSLAHLGEVELAGTNLTNGLDVLKTFVSVIKQSGVTGYRSGASVEATGYKEKEKAGYAGGFVGNMIGGEIWGETSSCTVTNVNTVTAKNAVGGFAGQILPGSAASVDTSSSNALLDGLLNSIIDTNGDLASVLNATLSTVRNVQITTTNGKGIVVQGAYSDDKGETAYAKSAGGFAGTISGAIIGAKDKPDENSDAAASGSETESSKNISLRNLQAVNGGEYAGGFAGKADTSAIAEVSGAGDTSVLDSLLNIGGLDVLDILRPYIFSAEVCGTEDYGFEVKANTAEKLTDINQEAGLYSGSAGGFIGGLLSGTVENSDVDQLRSVEGVNYSGGFVGHTGKSGLVDVDGIEALENILAVGAGVADVIGSDVNSCSVDGIADGFTVKSSGGKSQIVGGFVGYADLGRMKSNTVNNLKQVSSKEIAGGFVGKTSYEYLVNLTGGGVTVDILSKLLDALLKQLLSVDGLENGQVIKINLGIIEVNALWDGNLLSVNLLGIPIKASLVEGSTQLKVTIGDSEITLGIDPDDPTIDKDELENKLQVNLIKANRTRIVDSTVTGIDIGYDVFGGGASNDQDGKGNKGYAGGFAGFNNEGLLENNKMIKADTIRGTEEKVGEFDGGVSLESVRTDLDDIEKGNTYQVYRLWDDGKLKLLCNKAGDVMAQAEKAEIGDTEYYLYSVNHMTADLMNHDDWKDAYQTPSEGSAAQFPVKVYVSNAQADLMLGTPTEENVSDPDKIGETAQDPCAVEATLTIQKLWIDNNNQLGKRPNDVTVQITQDGKEYKSIEMRSKPTDADKNSWTWSGSVPIGVMNTDGTAYDKVYKYDVNETPVDGYTTIYNWSKDGYTLYIFNYLTSELVQGDSVVIDYGLPVQIDVLANDRVTENDALETLEGVAVRTGDTQPGTTVSTISSAMKTEAEGSHGTAALKEVSSNTDGDTSAGSSENAQKIIEYTPGTMQMNSIDKFTYGVKLNDQVVKNGQNYVYGSLDVIPATEIYYEDNFNEDVTIKYDDQTGAEKAEDGVITPNAWTTVGTSTADVQDTDRPGINTDKIIEDVYGNDSHYASDKTYSGGSSHVIRVDKTTSSGLNGPKATFTFTGTGFDFISKTAGDTGAIRVFIYKGEKGATANDANIKNRLKIITVQTYYGYKYSEEGEWELVDQANLSESALYQIPVIKYEAPEYGTYTVEIRPFYSTSYDKQSQGHYDLYVDGLRIYNPAGTSAKDNQNYNEIEDIYKQDGEVNPQFMELRDLLLNASGVVDTDKNAEEEEGTEPASLKNGIVYIDGKAEDVSLSEYKAYGPDNEVYLKDKQAVAFYLTADQVPDSIELAAKLAKGDSANLSFACAVENTGTSILEWVAYKTKTVTVTSAYDMHYSISNQCWWEQTGDGKYQTKYPIIVYRKSADNETDDSSIISLTNLNWTGTAADGTPIEITAYTDADAAMAAYSLMAVRAEQEEHTVTVLYQDQDGNQLADPAVQTVADGASYDMAELVDHQIEGYVQKEILGDPIQGTADTDKVITVVYEKEAPKLYTVTVSYVDREGNVLSEAYVQENAAEGTSYDLTEQTGKEIKGYEIAEITGDAVKGTVSGDVNVTVVYEKEPSVIDTIVDAVVDGINKVVDGINDWVSDVVSSIFPWW